jgi:hypothetical protein
MDQKELEGRKRLNVLKHESVRKREQIEKLQTIFKQLKLDDTRDNELEIEQVSVNDIFRTIPVAPNLPWPSGAPEFTPGF